MNTLDIEQRLTRYHFKYSSLFNGDWTHTSLGDLPGNLDSVERLLIECLNALCLALEKRGLSPLHDPIPPFPDFSFYVASMNKYIFFMFYQSVLRDARHWGYDDRPWFMSDGSLEQMIKSLSLFYDDETWLGTPGIMLLPLSTLDMSSEDRQEWIRVAADAAARELSLHAVPSRAIDAEFCFVIMSFSGNPHLEDFYSKAIKPTVQRLGYRCERVSEQAFNGSIRKSILDNIQQARFVIADMTEARPNCYYELGVAHALGKEVVHLTNNIKDVHFDIKDFNFIVYSRQDELSKQLRQRILATIGMGRTGRRTTEATAARRTHVPSEMTEAVAWAQRLVQLDEATLDKLMEERRQDDVTLDEWLKKRLVEILQARDE